MSESYSQEQTLAERLPSVEVPQGPAEVVNSDPTLPGKRFGIHRPGGSVLQFSTNTYWDLVYILGFRAHAMRDPFWSSGRGLPCRRRRASARVEDAGSSRVHMVARTEEL